MKIYVAAAWAERPRAKQIMQQLRDAGHTITFDWTGKQELSIDQAQFDMQGVEDCDALVFLAEKNYNSTGGAFCEMGMALALRKPVYIIGEGISGCIFTRLPHLIHHGIGRLLAENNPPDIADTSWAV